MVRRTARGFTLVELLVVIAIMSMLMGLLIVAAGGAINMANRTTCTQSQQELFKAIQLYETRKQRYPGYVQPVSRGPMNPNTQVRMGSWIVAIMPYWGKQDIYDTWSTWTATPLDPFLKELVCPADDQVALAGPFTSYVVNCGIGDGPVSMMATPAMPDTAKDNRNNGIFMDHRPQVTPVYVSASDVQKFDGASTTLMIAENVRADTYTAPTAYTDVPAEWLRGFVFQNGSTIRPINQFDTMTNQLLKTTAVDHSGARINSPHPGGAVVTFADGHSIFVLDTLAIHVYNKMCTPNGAQVIENAPNSGPGGFQLPLDAAELPSSN